MGDVLVLLSILSLRTCSWGSGVGGTFSASLHLLSPAAKHCIGGGSWEGECFLPRAQGNLGLVAFASALPPEADLCLVTLTGRRVSYSLSPGANRFYFCPGSRSRRFAAPLPAA